MAYYESIYSIPEPRITNNCIDNECSNCGECCSDLLPLTKEELRRLQRFAKTNRLKEQRQSTAPLANPNATDFTCPFRNQADKKCDAYPVRPLICRSFICQKSLQDARRDRDQISEKRKVYSIRKEVFGNPETMDYINAAMLMKVFE